VEVGGQLHILTTFFVREGFTDTDLGVVKGVGLSKSGVTTVEDRKLLLLPGVAPQLLIIHFIAQSQ
jgi:hypothetical protein